jgi:D-arabinose 1-dehydrogenase-like Zn-dependent alcohol dehydrogenase
VLSLARTGWIHASAKKIEFGYMNRTFDALADGKIKGRAVLIPSKR